MEADGEERPVAVTLRPGERLRVTEVQDTWRIDDEWWRERPVSRVYVKVVLENGAPVTVFCDFETASWYEQGC